MKWPRTQRSATFLVASLLLAGCGDPRTARYHDPNIDRGFSGSGSGEIQEPVAKHGEDAHVRAIALGRLDARLLAARTVLAGGAAPIQVRTLLESARADYAVVAARAAAADPSLHAAADDGLARAHDAVTTKLAIVAIDRFGKQWLTRLEGAVIAEPARKDAAFTAAVFASLIETAGLAYEHAFQSGDAILRRDEYRLAYGLLLSVNDRRYLSSIPEFARADVRGQIESIASRYLQGPSPPERPPPVDRVTEQIFNTMDRIAEVTNVERAPGELNPGTADRLRLVRDALGRARQAYAAGASRDARREVVAAYEQHLSQAASGLATTSPDLLAGIEHGLILGLLPLIEQNVPAAEFEAKAADLDVQVDDARRLVQQSLDEIEAERGNE